MRLIDADNLMTEIIDSDLDHLQRDDWKEVIQIVQDAPTIEPMRKKGKWIPSVDRWGDIMTGYKCSECGSFNTDKGNFCPACGCQMMRGDAE